MTWVVVDWAGKAPREIARRERWSQADELRAGAPAQSIEDATRWDRAAAMPQNDNSQNGARHERQAR